MAAVGDIWYRFEDVQYAPYVDEWDNPVGEGRLVVELRTYAVTKVTPKGVRLDRYKVVLDSSNKKFACPTKELAKISFVARKQRQINILSKQLARAEKALKLVDLTAMMEF